MKRIVATIAVAALMVTAGAMVVRAQQSPATGGETLAQALMGAWLPPESGLIASARLLEDAWADDEAKGVLEQREQEVSLDQVPPPVRATIERESTGGQVAGISQATERGKAAYAVKIAKDGQKTTMYVGSDGTVVKRGGADDDDED